MNFSFCIDIYQMLCKKYPNQNIYVIGDHHFFHNNIISYTRSQFHDVLEMNRHIIEQHNHVVGKDDIVIFLGDFSFKNGFIQSILEQMNGHKYLIGGNHDAKNLEKNYPTLGFEGVYVTPIKIQDHYLSHEPLTEGNRLDLQFKLILQEFQKCIQGVNYHGHIHEKDYFISNNYCNVSCEAVDYLPLLIGKTTSLINQEHPPLFINSHYFDDVLFSLKKKHNIDPSLFITDYIYSYLLENCSDYQNDYFVHGSFGLLKKYYFLSKMSDLDISMFYKSCKSKGANISSLKSMVDDAYTSLKSIDGINLLFLKRYSSLRMFEARYTSQNSYFSDCIFDANLIFLDCYKDTDFIKLKKESLLQKSLPKEYYSLTEEFHFPSFQANFLKPQGDIANLLLQFLFQKGHDEKKNLILKKLLFVYKKTFYHSEVEDLSNVFVRFFLRNISFLNTLRRFQEIEYIQNNDFCIPNIEALPYELQAQIHDILDVNSEFSDIFQEVSSIKPQDTLIACEKIIRELQLKK